MGATNVRTVDDRVMSLIRLGTTYARHTGPVLCCFAVALAIAALPYPLWSLALGHWTLAYTADPDNRLYLQIASHAYFNHPWYISDPSRAGVPTHYPWSQFVPFVLCARLLRLGPFGVNLLWRLWAAVGVAFGFFGMFWRSLRSRLAAAACTVFVLADSGLITAHPMVHQLSLLARIISGHAGAIIHDWPPILRQWRVVDPAVGLPIVLVHIIAVLAARERPTRGWLVGAGLSFGVLFYVYFYYWTAAAAALAVAFALDRDGRALYARAACIGLAIGAPELVQDYWFKAVLPKEAMQRFGFFVPMPRLAGLMLPKSMLVLLPLLLVWLWKSRRLGLAYLWALALVGLVRNNLGAIVGVDLQQGHWQYVWGPAAEVLLLIFLVTWVRERPRVPPMAAVRIMLVALGLYAMSGLFLEGFDVLRTDACRTMLTTYRMYSSQAQPADIKLMPRTVLAGDEGYVDFAAITMNVFPLYNYAVLVSPSTTDREWQL